MKPETWPRVRGLFEAALDLEPDEREAFLERECAGDRALLGEVLALLRADTGESAATPLLDTDPRSVLATRDLVGATIGGFRVVRLLGAGGMGAVYEAQQERPQRTVALKTLAVRFPSERARRRFEDEADILARLRHPAIAQVLAAGTTRVGELEVPWFAMELVEEPRTLVRYVREERLDPPRIAALLRTVCEAVHYAHQRGVIHRDLKPANVLVDRHGQPKIIDFGIARVADRGATARYTRAGEILGTLAYMAPERLEHADDGAVTAADTAGDVYSLGVILYEVLAGRSPFPLEELSPAQVVDVLRAADPTPLARANPAAPRELGWITMKAMARESARRYASVAELAQDLERHLRNEPVAAGPPSAAYRLRKLAWRYRALVAMTAVVFLALAVGLVVAMLGWRRVAQAELAARADAERASAAEQKALREAAVLNQVNAFQQRILRSAYGSEKGREVRLAEVVDAAAHDLEESRFTDPWVEIGTRTSIAISYLGLGQVETAERHLLRAQAVLTEQGLDPRTTWGVNLRHNLAACYEQLGKLELAETESRAVLTDRLALSGNDDELTARAQNNLAALLHKRAAYAEALELATQALHTFDARCGPGSEEAIIARANVAMALAGTGRDADADRAFDETQALAEQHLGADHPARLAVAATRAAHLLHRGRVEESLAACQDIAARRERLHGPSHPSTLLAWNNLGAGQIAHGAHADAEVTFRKVLAGQEAAGTKDGYSMIITRQNLTVAIRRQGRAAEAEALAREQREIATRTLPKDHWLLGVVIKELGGCLCDLGRMEEAEPRLLGAHKLLERALGPNDYRTQKCVGELVALYEAWQRPQDAAAWSAKRKR